MKNELNFRIQSAIIVCHDAMFGPPHELRDYMLTKGVGSLLFIGHPNKTLEGNDVTSSYYEIYENGKKIKRYVSPVWNLPEFAGYIKDSILTLYWSVTLMKRNVDYFIGLGNLNAFAGLVFKAFGLTKRVYYYVIDYIPDRFSNKIVNLLYTWLDHLCARFSDTTWNYGARMIQERNKKWNIRYSNQIVVPNGIRMRTGIQKQVSAIHEKELIYLGVLHDKQGLQLIFKALPLIKKTVPSIRISIIGKGEYRKTLDKLALSLHIQNQVEFVGYIGDPGKADQRVSLGALGLAMYDPKDSFVKYAEPGKVKRYLACGVPVIMTDVAPVSKELIRNSCGIVCTYDYKEFARQVVTFLSDRKRQEEYRKNAYRFALGYQWKNIFQDAFERSN